MKINNNATDTNVGNMENNIEEDVKIVEDFIDGVSVFLPKYSTKKVEKIIDEESYIAIKHILSDYKKLQEEFKAVDHECSRLERKEVEQEKTIDLMVEHIFYNQSDKFPIAYSIKDVKDYFINKAKGVKQ